MRLRHLRFTLLLTCDISWKRKLPRDPHVKLTFVAIKSNPGVIISIEIQEREQVVENDEVVDVIKYKEHHSIT